MRRITKRDAQERIGRFNRETPGLMLKMFDDEYHKKLAVITPRGGANLLNSYLTYRQVLEAVALISDYIAMSKGEGVM